MPLPLVPITPGERQCLAIVHDILAAGKQPTISAVARRMRISKGGANHHMRALREKGRLQGPIMVGEWALTAAGKKDLANA